MSDFQMEFGVQISYRKAHMAKEIAMKQIRCSFEDSYRILCDYRLEMKRTNPGTVDNLWTDDDCWSWFIANLDETLEHCQNLTIVSDRMKGLTNAMKDVLPTARHCYCCRHISQNIQAKFKNYGIAMKFWRAVHTTRSCEYENYMAEIRSIDVGAHDYISAIGSQHWANAFIDRKCYDMLTTNIAESTNSLLKDIRELPITQQIEFIQAKLMEFYQVRREKGPNMKTRVTPYVYKLINREKEASRRLHCW
ncbi:hypothetical protein AAC387_Pa08g1582 [Persea americana]